MVLSLAPEPPPAQAPHLGEECWSALGHPRSLADEAWVLVAAWRLYLLLTPAEDSFWLPTPAEESL